jgi:hypothetical protein
VKPAIASNSVMLACQKSGPGLLTTASQMLAGDGST